MGGASSSRDALVHWSSYWAHGFLHSCGTSFAGNYGEEFSAVWHGFFAGLPDGARILDVGTGNGAIAFLARDIARANGRAFEIHAADAAEIRPEAVARTRGVDASGINFHGRTPAEQTGFPAASFAAVTSQFGIEYAEWPAAGTEVRRLLAPGGRCCFVMHHADSVIVATSAEEISHADFLLDTTQVLELARRMMQRLQAVDAAVDRAAAMAALQADPEAEAGRLAYNAAAASVTERIGAAEHPDLLRLALGAVGEALKRRKRESAAAAINLLGQVEREIRYSRRRLQDLQSAACDAARLEARIRVMKDRGLSVRRCEPLERPGTGVIGWVLEADAA